MSNSMDPGGLRKLERALASLPFMQREIFLAHARDGLSGVEIAWLMGLGERYVERQLAMAIYKLGKQLDGQRLSFWERWF